MKYFVLYITTLATAILITVSAPAAEWYVSPEGEAGHAGTAEAPLDLVSVLAGGAVVRPGDAKN